MKIRFTKMHGLGNAFVVIDAVRQKFSLTLSQAIQSAERSAAKQGVKLV